MVAPLMTWTEKWGHRPSEMRTGDWRRKASLSFAPTKLSVEKKVIFLYTKTDGVFLKLSRTSDPVITDAYGIVERI